MHIWSCTVQCKKAAAAPVQLLQSADISVETMTSSTMHIKAHNSLHLTWLKRSSEHCGNVQSTASKLTRPQTSLDDTCQTHSSFHSPTSTFMYMYLCVITLLKLDEHNSMPCRRVCYTSTSLPGRVINTLKMLLPACFSTMTVNFNPLNPNSKAFNTVPKCVNAVLLVKSLH